MSISRSTVLVCLTLLYGAPTAQAQRVVVGYRTTPFGEAVTQIHNLTIGTVESSEAGVTIQQPLATSDGRYLTFYGPTIGANTDPQPLQIRDLVTGTTMLAMVDFDRVVAHPREPAIFGLSRATGFFGFGRTGYAARLDASGVHEFGGCAPGTTRAVDLSVNGAWLVALCSSGEVAVLDAATGAMRSLVAASATGSSIGASHDASRALVIRATAGGAHGLALIETATGAEVASAPAPGPSPAAIPCTLGIVGLSRDRALAGVTCTRTSTMPPFPNASHDTYLVSMETLAFGPRLPLPFHPSVFTISPDNQTLFYTSFHFRGFSALNIVDLTANTATLDATLYPTALAVSHPPLPATAVHAVSGRRVDLTWTLPVASPAATAYTVHAGSEPGASDVRFPVGAATALSVPSVPPGRYYVRVVAENAVGAGAVSNLLVVDVP